MCSIRELQGKSDQFEINTACPECICVGGALVTVLYFSEIKLLAESCLAPVSVIHLVITINFYNKQEHGKSADG